MSKDTFYFPHDYSPTEDPKIMAMLGEYGATGYGLYWRIVEMLHSDTNHKIQAKQYLIIAIAKQMQSTPDFVNQFISDCVNIFELFIQENDLIYCDRVMRNISKRSEISDKRKAAGSKGGVAKASNCLAKSGKEKKEKKESKVFIAPTVQEVISYFLENGYQEQFAVKAFNYYNSAGWKNSKGKKVQNWKQTMQGNWFKDEYKIQSTKRTISSFI